MSVISTRPESEQRSASTPAVGTAPNAALLMSTTAVSLLAVVVITGLAGVMAPVFRGGIDHAQRPDEIVASLVAQHDQALSEYRARFVTRNVFFPPPAKQAGITHRTTSTQAATSPATHPVRTTYGGPSIAWVIGDDVYFHMPVPTKTRKYQRLHLGQESEGLKVLSTENMPRSVRVEHEGVAFDVKVFGEGADADLLFDVDNADQISGSLDALVPVEGAR